MAEPRIEVEEVPDEPVSTPAEAPVETPVEASAETSVETPAEPSTPTDVPDAPAEAPVTQFSLREFIKQAAGRDLSKYQTDEEAAKGIDHAIRLASQRSEKERNWDQVAPLIPQFQEFLAAQQQAAQQPTQQPAPLFSEPQLEDGDMDWIEDTESGRRLRLDTPPDVRKRILDRTRYIKALQENPGKVFAPVLDRVRAEAVEAAEERAYQRVMQTLQQQKAQEYEQQTIGRIKSERQAQVVQRNSAGQPIYDETGLPVLTPYGQAYAVRETELFRAGVADHAMRDQLAHEYAASKAQAKPAPALAPGATRPAAPMAQPAERPVPSGSLAQMIMQQNPGIKPTDIVDGVLVH